MVNSSDILQNNYNLSKIFNQEPITNPTKWIGAFNEVMRNYYVVSILAVIGVALFLMMKNKEGVSDSEAVLYAGLICSIAGLFLFLADVILGNSVKLLSWGQLVPFFVITGGALFMDHIRRKY